MSTAESLDFDAYSAAMAALSGSKNSEMNFKNVMFYDGSSFISKRDKMHL